MSRTLFRHLMTGALALAMLGSGALYAANGKPVANDKPVAIVNGHPISQATFDLYVKVRTAQRPGQHLTRDQVINELVGSELLYQEALRQKLDKNREVQEEIKLQRMDVLINAALSRELKAHPISEAQIKKTYEEKVAHANVEQYKARHILTKTEAQAKDIIKQLGKGASFAALAEKYSIDKGSAKQGGELGWFSAGQMVPPFAKAVAALKKGSYTKEPVHTQFGWHVIELENKRRVQPPSFDEVKGRIAAALRREQLSKYVDSLRKKAKIEIIKQ